MKTLIVASLLLVSLILSETALAGCPGGVCPNGVGRSYSRSYRSYGSSRGVYGRSYGGYAGVADCGAPSSYGAVGYESVNHRESTHVGIFGRVHTHVKHHHHRHVTPVVTP